MSSNFTHTPRREPRRSGAHTPHTPGERELNIVSRVGVAATAETGVVRGLLCVKLGIPRESSGTWSLFSGPTPRISSAPALYPLPVTPYLLKRSVSSPKRNNLQRAVGLLGLQTRDYPPVTADGPQPRLDLVRGQVTVTVEETPRRTSASAGSSSRKNSTPGGSLRDRAEFLAIIEFDVPVSTRVQGTDAAFLASIPVPRCLDNLLRLQLPCDSDSEASVSIEPKVLPNPRRDEADPFRSRVATGNRIEDGWEDGEVPGAESDEASEDDDDEGGSWVEGRFPSTDRLELQWTFIRSRDAPPTLSVAPRWDVRRPAIEVAFEAGVPASDGVLGIEAVLPPGWAWRDLEIVGEGLRSWRSTDEDLASDAVEPARDLNDSVATALPPSPTLLSTHVLPLDASRLEPLNADELAALDDADFSLNDSATSLDAIGGMNGNGLGGLGGIGINGIGGGWQQLSRRRSREGRSPFHVAPRVPLPAGLFELDFDRRTGGPVDSDDEDDERRMHLKGTLVPLPYVLVCADVPVSIPFVRFDQPSLPTQCTVHCGNASFPGSGGEGAAGTVHAQARLCSTSGSYVGTFEWTAGASASAPTRVALPVNGPVRIAAQRSMWGMQTIQAVWESTQRPAEVALVLGVPGVRVQSATVARSPLAHTVLPVGSGSEVRISARRGRIEVVLEADEAGAALVLPCFPGGSGEVSVELVGDRWEQLLVHEPKTNLKRLGSTTFAGDLAAPPLFEFVAEPKSETDTSVSSKSNTKTKVKKSRTCTPQRALTRLSALTLILLVVWILASLAQKMADLQADVAFVADEVRDLRMVALERERERERARWWRAAEPEETQAEPSAAGSAKVKETGKAKGDINEKGQGQERKDNMDKGNADEPRPGASATTSPKSTALVPPSHAEHGVGRVVFRPWLAWKDLPVLRTITNAVGNIWRTLMWLISP